MFQQQIYYNTPIYRQTSWSKSVALCNRLKTSFFHLEQDGNKMCLMFITGDGRTTCFGEIFYGVDVVGLRLLCEFPAFPTSGSRSLCGYEDHWWIFVGKLAVQLVFLISTCDRYGRVCTLIYTTYLNSAHKGKVDLHYTTSSRMTLLRQSWPNEN